MRKLAKFFVFWAISGTLFYVFGIPYALEQLQAKTRNETYTQCVEQLRQQGMVGLDNSSLNTAQGDEYCHCVADPLLFTQDDLMDMAQRKPPTKLTAQAQAQVVACNKTLEDLLSGGPAPTINPAGNEVQPDGTEIVHF